MIRQTKQPGSVNVLLQLKPLQRVLLGFVIAAIVFVVLQKLQLSTLLLIAACWTAFAISVIVSSWFVFFKLPVDEIINKANREDGGRVFVFLFILLSSFASLITVLLLVTGESKGIHEVFTVIISVLGMMVSWVMVHTIFTFHYAHLYYFEGRDDTPKGEALDFPGTKKPDYLDFAYFSFIIGMTFQVSDVSIHSRITRRTVLAHSLLSFALNTFVVALTINLVAGLKS